MLEGWTEGLGMWLIKFQDTRTKCQIYNVKGHLQYTKFQPTKYAFRTLKLELVWNSKKA
jgi:hypothetical protein